MLSFTPCQYYLEWPFVYRNNTYLPFIHVFMVVQVPAMTHHCFFKCPGGTFLCHIITVWYQNQSEDFSRFPCWFEPQLSTAHDKQRSSTNDEWQWWWFTQDSGRLWNNVTVSKAGKCYWDLAWILFRKGEFSLILHTAFHDVMSRLYPFSAYIYLVFCF